MSKKENGSHSSIGTREKEGLLWWRVVDEFNPLLDVALQASLAGLKELLLIGADIAKDVGCLLRTRWLILH